jgi:hypothetical protein
VRNNGPSDHHSQLLIFTDKIDLKFSKVEEANEADKQLMNSYDVSVKFSNFRNIFMRNIEASAHKNRDRGT